MRTTTADWDVEAARIKDHYAKRKRCVSPWTYSRFSPGHLFMIQERERCVLALLKQGGFARLESMRILDVGCGTGGWLRDFVTWGARPENCVGVDLLPDRIAEARERCPSAMTFYCASAHRLEFPDGSFDLVLQSVLFSSILELALKQQVAREMLRVLRPSGAIVWYDFFVDSPGNPLVRGVGKSEIRRLFTGCKARFRRVTLAPPFVRKVAPYSWLACYLLSELRVLNTFYLALIRGKG
jgi:SAM-dependent methyltransferase